MDATVGEPAIHDECRAGAGRDGTEKARARAEQGPGVYLYPAPVKLGL